MIAIARTTCCTARLRMQMRAFTLAELLVAMAVIAVVATITVVAVKGITEDARLSSGQNAVTAALATARGRAIADNRVTGIVFRPRLTGPNDDEQFVEIVTVQWLGETAAATVAGDYVLVDRYAPVPDLAPRELPVGIKVAGPAYLENDNDNTDEEGNEDFLWLVQAHLPALDPTTGQGENAGRLIAVLYAPDGTTITRNPVSDAGRFFVDFDGDFTQNIANQQVEYGFANQPSDFEWPTMSITEYNQTFFDQTFEEDEPFFSPVPFLSVYDDEEARELRTTDWTAFEDYRDELTGPQGYISNRADRIHFNRYTGVIMR